MLQAPEHFTPAQLKDLETFKGYNAGPLKLLIKNETTSYEKKEVLQFILDNLQTAKASAKTSTKTPKEPKEPKAAKAPKEPKEPKTPKNPRITDDKTDFVFVEGQIVLFPEGRGDDAPVVKGTITKRFEKDGVRRYIIVKDGSNNMKRQATLLKHNDLSAPVEMAPVEVQKEKGKK